jgi:hypothetical protein
VNKATLYTTALNLSGILGNDCYTVFQNKFSQKVIKGCEESKNLFFTALLLNVITMFI